MTKPIDRRTFVCEAAALTALTTSAFGAAASPTAVGSNDRVRLGIIGVGNRGDQLLDAFHPHKDAQIVAICDVYEPYREAARKKVGGEPRMYQDFRKLLEQKDIDAVIIATPDHWHASMFAEACQAGKDVYVEKPASLTISEGRQMVNIAKDTSRVTQVGLHRRSSKVLAEAIERVRSGEIGHVSSAHCYHLSNEYPMGIGNPPDGPPPEGLDWDMWLGPAPKVAYNPNRCFYKFRWFRDYSGGQVTNQGTHYLDLIQWALGQNAPQSVSAIGGKYAVKDNREIPDTLEVVWQYPGSTLATFSQHNANATSGGKRGELELRGTEGTLVFGGNGYAIVPEANRTLPIPALSPIDRAGNKAEGGARKTAGKAVEVAGTNSTSEHARNFLDCVKSRHETNCSIETGHRSTTATLLANVAFDVGRSIRWDATKEQVVDDAEANRHLARTYRAPWKQIGGHNT